MTPTTEPKTDKTYNGWPNYQTWNVMLWLDNDESAYRYYRDCVERLKDRRRRLTAMRAKAIAINAMGDQTGDGVSLSNSRIRWTAIARAMEEN